MIDSREDEITEKKRGHTFDSFDRMVKIKSLVDLD